MPGILSQLAYRLERDKFMAGNIRLPGDSFFAFMLLHLTE